MPDLTPAQYALAIVAFLAGGTVKGTIGVALPIVSIGIMAQSLDPLVAVSLMVIPIITTNFWLALSQGVPNLVISARRFWPLILTCLLVMGVTAYNAVNLPTSLVLGLVGVVLILFVAANLFAPSLRLPPSWEVPGGICAGLCSGLLGGATSIYGPPINLYLMTLHLEKKEWVRSVGVTYSLAGLPLIVGYGLNGMMTPHVFALSSLACIPSVIGLWLGLKLQAVISQQTFRKVLLVALTLMGINFIWRAFG